MHAEENASNMADFSLVGFIEGIRYTETAAAVTVCERRLGYTKKDGTRVMDEIISYRVVFKSYFKKYISSNFTTGMLVKIKGIVLPYAKDASGKTIDGITLLGQTIDRDAYPRSSMRQERKMIKESSDSVEEQPDLDGYMEKDFT